MDFSLTAEQETLRQEICSFQGRDSDPALIGASVRQTLGEIRRNGSESGRLRAAELLGRASGLFDTRPPAPHLHLQAEISDRSGAARGASPAAREAARRTWTPKGTPPS